MRRESQSAHPLLSAAAVAGNETQVQQIYLLKEWNLTNGNEIEL